MHRNRAGLEASRNGVLWVFQLFGAMLFLISASAKLSGDEKMIEMFAVAGIGQWLRYIIATVGLASAILLLIPAFSGIGALVLVPTMVGVTLTQLLIIGGSPAFPIVLLFVVSVVALGRKETTLRLFWRNISQGTKKLLCEYVFKVSQASSHLRNNR